MELYCTEETKQKLHINLFLLSAGPSGVISLHLILSLTSLLCHTNPHYILFHSFSVVFLFQCWNLSVYVSQR